MTADRFSKVLAGFIGLGGLTAFGGLASVACSAAPAGDDSTGSAVGAEPGEEETVRDGLWDCKKSYAKSKTSKKTQWWTCPDPDRKHDIGKGYKPEDLQYVYACPDGKTPKRRKCEIKCIRGPVPSDDVCATDPNETGDKDFTDSAKHTCADWADHKATTITAEEAKKANWLSVRLVNYDQIPPGDVVSSSCAGTAEHKLCCPMKGETIRAQGTGGATDGPKPEEQAELNAICQQANILRAACGTHDGVVLGTATSGAGRTCDCVGDLESQAQAECVSGLTGAMKDKYPAGATADGILPTCGDKPADSVYPLTTIGGVTLAQTTTCYCEYTAPVGPAKDTMCSSKAGPDLGDGKHYCSDTNVSGKGCSQAAAGDCNYCCTSDPTP